MVINYIYQANWPRQFAECGLQKQTPINIDTQSTKYKLLNIKFNYFDHNWSYKLENNGHSADLTVTEDELKPSISFNSQNYMFNGLHFHWGTQDNKGSEHSIDNRFYALELHFVHYNQKYGSLNNSLTKPDGLLVLGVLAQLSQTSNLNLKLLTKAVKQITKYKSTISIPTNINLQLNKLMPKNINEIFIYKGSLTIPPCYQSVIWLVIHTPINISIDQLNAFRNLKGKSGNKLLTTRRNICPLNGRIVYTTKQK
ncbi:carbonic anhydrase 2-like [Oppia nitens]|uniref:carbonic anhydrase 2-like n=1 Tax=Oppia nitens TaxID=1686743 RepID=UPI0023DC8CC5|nr:carbonic anhydrase 2-like [Oppia nitens]